MSEDSKKFRDQAARCLRERRKAKSEGLRRALADVAASYKDLALDEEKLRKGKLRSQKRRPKTN
jgi:hypothetical protein